MGNLIKFFRIYIPISIKIEHTESNFEMTPWSLFVKKENLTDWTSIQIYEKLTWKKSKKKYIIGEGNKTGTTKM